MILDYTDNLQIKDHTKYLNEINQLVYLKQGLCLLFNEVKQLEYKLQKEPYSTIGFGNIPGLEWIPWGLLTCYFHWYSVSLCNYVKLVGWIFADANQNISPKDLAKKYMEEVLPEVYIWRHKVGAHYAKSDKRKDLENEMLSTMLQITIDQDRFYAGQWKSIVTVNDNVYESEFKPWSLTKIHETMVNRFGWE